jgi:hypothetical protein
MMSSIHTFGTNEESRYRTPEIPAGTRAYGICVFTWAMWSDPAKMDDITVVSDIGLQWSPKIAPANTAPMMM